MNRIAHFIHLDFYTINPYKKALYLLILVGLVMGIIIESISALPAIIMMGLLVVMSYPFSIGEKNGMDTLYATLPIKRKSVVTGRYAFVFCMEIIAAIFALLLSAALSVIFTIDLNVTETLVSLCFLTAVFSLVVSLQYPLYFKFGYTKGQPFAYLFLSLGILAIAVWSGISENLASLTSLNNLWEGISANPYLMFGLPVGIGFLFLALSCALSCRLYEKRDI
ncbi:MAG: ABC-2 transporter permease [Chloroflexi bacterium]|nr:ABC-2 transporter permease [Chloroflexota bacterium]